MFTTMTSPVMFAQADSSGCDGRTTISVAETDWTNAGTPASVTATGAWNPWPKIVTGENGGNVLCVPLEIEVTLTAGEYENVTVAFDTMPEAMFLTVTGTV